MSLRLKLALTVIAATIAAGGGVGAARSADDVECGSVVTEDTTLTHDLSGCPGTGLIVAGTDVTLDLGGHTVSGTGNGFGIQVRAGGVTVQNGTVSSFGSGIDGEGDFRPGPAGGTIRDVTITSNGAAGIVLINVDDWRIDSDVVFGNDTGIFFSRTRTTVVTDSFVAQNAGAGIFSVSSSDGNTFSGNRVLHNDGDGILVSNSTSRIIGNRASFNGGNGIVLHESPGFSDVIADNVADGNGQLGITADFPGFDGGGNAAKHNGDPRECVNVSCAKNAGQAD
jgi:parallel beta-helix repeat protein